MSEAAFSEDRCTVSPWQGPSEVLRPFDGDNSPECRAGTPSFLQGSGIDHVESELINQASHNGFGILVIAGNCECATIWSAGRLPVGGERCRVDMVKGFDDFRGRKMSLEEL